MPGRELLVIQLLEDIIASLYRIAVGCAVYLRAVRMVPHGITVSCHKVGCKPCFVPWVTKLDVDHKGVFLLFQKVEGQTSTPIVLVACSLEYQVVFDKGSVGAQY